MRDGDVLMVDKSIEPKAGKIVIAAINCEMTVRRLSEIDGQMTLSSTIRIILTRRSVTLTS